MDLFEFRSFFEKYQSFSKGLQRQKINQYKDNFDVLFDGYEEVKNIIQTRELEEATRYNIFDVLNVNFAETLAHTPFLRNLLDPRGTHGQRDLFLKHFLNKFIPNKKLENFLLPDDHDYRVVEEKIMNTGRIDIYIESLSAQKKFAIVIENKVYAADQFMQLERYHNFLTEHGLKNHQIMIFYLSPDGRNPSVDSIDNAKREDLKSEGVLQLVSYHKDINIWLEESLKSVKPEKLKVLINQYIKILETL